MKKGLSHLRHDLALVEDPQTKAKILFGKVINWSRVKSTSMMRQNRDIEEVMDTIDMAEFDQIRKKYDYDPAVNKPGKHDQYKWLNIEAYLPMNLKRIYRLDLHNQDPLDILDIGAGPGYFCYLCQYFGHQADAMDLGDHPVYNDMIPFFNLDRSIWKIEAFEPLPDLGKKYDLITAFLVCFNELRKPGQIWREEKWDFFLHDVADNYLKPGGWIYLRLNPEEKGGHYNKSLYKYFVSRGGYVLGRDVIFDANSIDEFRDDSSVKNDSVNQPELE